MQKILLPFLLLFANLCFAQVDLNLGLKAYYPFSGNANDVSGHNNHPVFNNATLTADRFGNPNSAYHFNGTNNYMRIPNHPTLNMGNTLSISMWVRPTGYYTGQCYNNMMLMKGDADYLPGNYSLRFSDAYTGCSATPTTTEERFYDGNGTVAQLPLVQLNQWYNVTVTYDGTTARLYVNCILRATTPFTGNFTNSFDVFLGHLNNAQFPYWLNGDLDEVRIYDRALTVDEVNVLGGCIVTTPCNNWLNTPSLGSTATIGNLNVTGNQITVEGSFHCTNYSTPNYGGNLVAKHLNTSNVCYALSPHAAELSTTNNGYIYTLQTCTFELNKTYHVAMVYDGASLKFYRDGFLMSQAPCSGNIASNNLPAIIGNGPGVFADNQFFGQINEVRIWNVARTQSQIRMYMNSSIPSPATQPGLLAYYTFDNLLNKQGNTAFNATLNGAATINATNPNCTFTADSCAVATSSVIINDYTPVLAFNPCDNKLTVENATAYHVGDTVLLIQMKGAVVDSTNSAAFGNVTDYKNAGNYEYNYIKSKTGNVIELSNTLTRQYDIPTGKVQLIRVPYYTDLTTTDTLTCLPWDGSKGGVLVFNVLNNLNLTRPLDVSGKGFKGGIDPFSTPAVFNCNENQFFYPVNPDLASGKGEGIADISAAKSFGKGALANGGGGGNSHNSGGAGGGNAGAGGLGGYQFESTPCNGTVPFDNRGIGGKSLTYSNAANKIFLGGGGGAGHTNNPEAFQATGGNGGGIIIVSAGNLRANSQQIFANGKNAAACGATSSGCHEGMGGGGAAGTILLQVNTYADNLGIETKGGKGADMTAAGFSRVGPGGGGSGGIVWVSNGMLPGTVSVVNTGGAGGVCTGYANNPWGTTAGAAGQNLVNLALPIDIVPFKKNIDSVRIKDSIISCNDFDFKGLAYINSSPVAGWQWYFGDGGQATTQNTTHTYLNAANYTVKLVVTDINGCKDSIAKTVSVPVFSADAGNNISLCNATLPVTIQLNATAGASYAWTPAALLNNPSIQNPVATISASTKFYVTITNAVGCSATDSVLITLATAPANTRYPVLNALPYQQLQLQARNIGGTGFQWLPNIGLNNNSIANPVFYYAQTQEYTVRITTAAGCVIVDTQQVVIKGTKGIYVPRGFSPNGDGSNDRLYPILVGIKQLNYFKVYNRWGNLVFETTSGRPEDGWDGTFKGKKQPVEAYTWVVEGVDIDNIVIRKNGNTLLIH